MNCPQCGAENPDTAANCNLCFAKFDAADQEAKPPDMPPPQWTAPPQPMPSGVWTPPPGGPPRPLPPGMQPQPPSDAFGYGGAYPRPPGPPFAVITPAKSMNPILMWTIRIAVIVVCFAIGWFGMDYVLTRPKIFTGNGGSYSFMYPGKWKKADSSSLAFTGLTGSDMKMEVGLADINSVTPNYIFLAGTASAPVDWPTAKARLIEGYSRDLTTAMSQGASISKRTFSDVTIDGKPGLSIKFSMTLQGTTYDCNLIIVQNSLSFQALMMMAKKPGGTLDKFQDIVKSFKFKT